MNKNYYAAIRLVAKPKLFELILSSMSENDILIKYQQMRLKAEIAWNQAKGVGALKGLPEGYFKIGITLGSNFTPAPPLNSFLNELEDLALSDPSLVLIPREHSHFTFLALAEHSWNTIDKIPQEISSLKEIIEFHLKNFKWNLSELQLVPGQNFLLLAGLPNEEARLIREKLTEDLISSVWKQNITQRHKGNSCPPQIWHTTICRYKYEQLSSPVQLLYQKYRNINFGNIELGTPILKAVNYDWSFSQTI